MDGKRRGVDIAWCMAWWCMDKAYGKRGGVWIKRGVWRGGVWIKRGIWMESVVVWI